MAYGRPIRDYYEQLWERLPDALAIPDLELRRRLMLGELRSSDRVLDLGCGAGTFTAIAARASASVIGVDVAQAALRRARVAHPKLDFRLAPIDGPLPLEDNAFDLVWATEVIEHVADTARWLSEIRRVLVSGGRLLLTTPNHSRATILVRGLEPFSDPLGDHLHLYTRRSLAATLSEFGFEQIEVRARAGPPLFRRLLLARSVRG
jgi:SAM-dependent methyltransferase